MKLTYKTLFCTFAFGFSNMESFGQLAFTPGPNSPFGTSPLVGVRTYMQAADFNGDGVADLAITSFDDNLAIRLVTDDGDATLTPTTLYSCGTGAGASGIATGDFDDDGDIDIAVVNFNTGSISRFKNNGNGTFAPMTNVATTFSGGKELIAFDSDGDGDLDLASMMDDSGNALLSILTNDGTFGLAESTLGLGTPYSPECGLAVGVFTNATNKPELIYVDATNTVRRIQDLDSTPSSTDVFNEVLSGAKFRRIAIGDFNLDGNTDIVLSSGNANPGPGNFVRILDGAGDGTFAAGTTIPMLNLDNTYDVFSTDLDNDGDFDLLASRRGISTQSLGIWRNTGGGSFAIESEPNIPNPGAITLGDFNMDGKPDVAITSTTGDNNFILLNVSAGGIADPTADVCIQTNGSGQITAPILLNKTTNFTIEGYFIANPAFGTRQYLFYNGFAGLDGFGLYIDDTGSGELFIEGVDNGGSSFDFSTGMNITTYGDWYHFAVVLDKSGNWHFYLNGTPRLNISTTTLLTPTTSTFIGGRNNTVVPFNLGLDFGNLQEYRFWTTALDTKTIREWMSVQIDKSHPKWFALTSYFPINENTGAVTQDIAYAINPLARYKQAAIIFPSTWDNTGVAPIGDNGSGEIENATANINSRIKTGIEIDFQTPSGGVLAISRVYDEASEDPLIAGLIYSKVYWTFRQYGGSATFPDLDELVIDIKDDQFQSGLYPILNTPSDPNPAAAAFKLFMRPIGSSNPADWSQVGEGIGFGSVKARRPGSTVSEFGRELVVGVDPSVLPVRLINFMGRKLNTETNLLEWKTAFEFENELFEIEKSYDGKSYFKIGTVEGKNKTNQISYYKFEDTRGTEAGYYRLRQKDKSGKISCTKAIYIASENPRETVFRVYPNPVNDEIRLITQFIENENLKLALYNNQGERIYWWEGNKQQVEYLLNKNLSRLQKGLYILKVSNDYQTYQTKFIKN